MPLFTRKNRQDKLSGNDIDWNEWRNHRDEENDPSKATVAPNSPKPRRPSVSMSRGPPRSILRNPSFGQSPTQEETRRASVPNANASPREHSPRDRLQSMPASNSLTDMAPKPQRGIDRHGLALSMSMSQLNARKVPQASTEEADRLDRACGQGAWAPARPQPTPLSRKSSRASGKLSRSLSRDASRSRDAYRGRSELDAARPRFPFPPIQRAIRNLDRVLRDRTKNFRLKDYLEPEEIVNGRIWEEEEETLVDCVRDRLDDEDGEDGVWRLERKRRTLQKLAARKATREDGNIFGAHLQDLPTSALARVIVGGYIHVVPMAVDACVEELYRTGVYQPGLFRTLPGRERLLYLVTRFDHDPTRVQATATVMGAGDAKIFAKTNSLRQERTADICALLVTYLTAFPDPMIHRSLTDALWAWCVSPSVIRQEQRLRKQGDNDASESEYETSEDEDENAPTYNQRLRQMEREYMNLPPLKVQILIAQHVLLLLPPRHFSLLVHLLTFFATLLICPENGLSLDDIGRIFGPMIVGGRTRQKNKQEGLKDAMENSGRDRDSKEKRVLMWLVGHWEKVAMAYELDESEEPPKKARKTSLRDLEWLKDGSRQGSRKGDRRASMPAQMAAAKPPQSPQGFLTPQLAKRDRRATVTNPAVHARANLGEPTNRSPAIEQRRFQDRSNDGIWLRKEPAEESIPEGNALQEQPLLQVPKATKFPDSAARNVADNADDMSIYSTTSEDVLGGILEPYLDGPVPGPSPRDLLFQKIQRERESAQEKAMDPILQQNEVLRKQLEEVRKERDEARGLLDAMRRVMHGAL